mgnify:CR=1 FL=1
MSPISVALQAVRLKLGLGISFKPIGPPVEFAHLPRVGELYRAVLSLDSFELLTKVYLLPKLN